MSDDPATPTRNWFQTVGQDPYQWYEKALELKSCAIVLRDKLKELEATPPIGRRIATNGLWACSSLLLGLAFENLTKAVFISRNPELVEKIRLNKDEWKSDGGHGITEFVCRILDPQKPSPAEKQLLAHLQEYLVWAGRYPIPVTAERLEKATGKPQGKKVERGTHIFLQDDIAVAEKLFGKILDAAKPKAKPGE